MVRRTYSGQTPDANANPPRSGLKPSDFKSWQASKSSSRVKSDTAVCLCCWVDAVTGGASKPDDLWYYSIKYDDGEEEHKVGPARIFPDK